ncbi:hypothetical protein J2805_003716 [Arthrobacter oryzae]|jgi:hypothetical protein|nr:hypothetical protein [Arthrobacter oryzae]
MNRQNLLTLNTDRPSMESPATDSCEDGCFFCTGPETD